MVDTVIPQDMRDLLIRLDQRVTDGFAAINARLDGYDRRAENIDVRVSALEAGEIKRAGELAGAQKLGGYLKVAVSALMAVVCYLGWQVELRPSHEVEPSKNAAPIPPR